MLSLCSVLVLVFASQAEAFSSSRMRQRQGLSSSTTSTTHLSVSSSSGSRSATVLLLAVKGSDDGYSDLPPEESTEYTGSVDWDAEWKKVVASEGKVGVGKERPGQGYYKSEAEIQAIKAANAATEKITEAGSSVTNSLPDFRSLSGDWRFWIAILAFVSVGLSLLTAPQNVVSSGLQGDSYYI